MQNNKYGIAGVVALVALFIIIGAVVQHNLAKQKNDKNSASNKIGPGSTAQTPSATDLNNSMIASALPKNFPVEPQSQILQGSEITDPAAKTVKVIRTTTTTKSLADAVKVYKDYLTKNGWTITDTTDVETLKVLSAHKGDATIKIVMSYDGVSKSNMVAVNYTTPQ